MLLIEPPFIPTPTPTPIPITISNSVVDKFTDITSQSFQAAINEQTGAVILIIAVGMVFIGILMAISFLLYQFARRNTPPREDVIAKANASALAAMQQLIERSEAERVKERTEAQEREEVRYKDLAARESKWLASMELMHKDNLETHRGYQSGLINLAELTGQQTPILKQIADQTADLKQLRADFHEGSAPVQDMRLKIEQMTLWLKDIKDNYLTKTEAERVINESIVKVFNQANRNIELVDAAIRTGIQEEIKRKTDSQPIPALSAPEKKVT